MDLQINALGIAVRDMGTMVNFYREALGFPLDWDGGGFAGARLSNGFFLNLYVDEDRPRLNPNKSFQFTINLNSPEAVDAEYARLTMRCAAPHIPPHDEPYGLRTCFVLDPEGNQIELCAEI